MEGVLSASAAWAVPSAGMLADGPAIADSSDIVAPRSWTVFAAGGGKRRLERAVLSRDIRLCCSAEAIAPSGFNESALHWEKLIAARIPGASLVDVIVADQSLSCCLLGDAYLSALRLATLPSPFGRNQTVATTTRPRPPPFRVIHNKQGDQATEGAIT